MQLSSYSDKSDIESQKGNNGRHQYSATGSGAGRSGGKTMVAGSLASIPPDALYTTTSKHTSVSTLSSKPDHEYENLKVRLEDAMSWMGHRGIGGIVRSVSRRGRQDTQTQVIVNQAYQWRLKYLFVVIQMVTWIWTSEYLLFPACHRRHDRPRPSSAAVSSSGLRSRGDVSPGPGRTVSSSHLKVNANMTNCKYNSVGRHEHRNVDRNFLFPSCAVGAVRFDTVLIKKKKKSWRY